MDTSKLREERRDALVEIRQKNGEKLIEFTQDLNSQIKEKPRRFLRYQRFWMVSYDLENGNKRLESIGAWDLKSAYDQFSNRVSSRAQQIKANR